MEFNFFLWPMLVPLVLPVIYCIIYRRNRLGEVLTLVFSMIIIVLFYWPLSLEFYVDANLYVKIFLFVLVPLILLFIYDILHRYLLKSDEKIFDWKLFGISSNGLEKSLKLGLIFLPIMLLASFIIINYSGSIGDISIFNGSIYFVESITEEILFRGILFLFLFNRLKNIYVAYTTSLLCFIFMHTQYFESISIVPTIIQGILTTEIVRRSNNLLGAWVLHGFNRFFFITGIFIKIFTG
ncbi:MAG: CPBP family intramembrane metalloprotease [Candidatus Thermoplasmatota archaeon]|nr:CPBP family intramembrane metalloprotease [Candidatus Thermoplasmatota archaeon]